MKNQTATRRAALRSLLTHQTGSFSIYARTACRQQGLLIEGDFTVMDISAAVRLNFRKNTIFTDIPILDYR